MPSRARLNWTGDELTTRVRAATAAALDDTVDAARDDAKETHAWKNDERLRRLKSGALVDTHLELQIKSEHADPGKRRLIARFGYTRVAGFYGLFHELGTTHEHEYPALRPAADREFPTLAVRIRRRLR